MATNLEQPGSARAADVARRWQPVVIEARGIKKSFHIASHKVDSLKERFTAFSRRDFKDLRASSAATDPGRAPC
jgi:hypothetical protein